MPILSMFYGVIIRMFHFDNQKHHEPHIHVTYQGQSAILSIPDGTVIEGEISAKKMKLVRAWIEIHQDELMADWELAVRGEETFKIEPLK